MEIKTGGFVSKGRIRSLWKIEEKKEKLKTYKQKNEDYNSLEKKYKETKSENTQLKQDV